MKGETLRAALNRELVAAIRSGALRAGARLPSSRVFAQELGVSRGVVTDVYRQLAAQGFLVATERSAPIVAPISPKKRESERRTHSDAERKPQPLWDLSPTTPDVTLFPATRWARTLQSVAASSPAQIFDYRESQGELALRELLAEHLGRTRGVIADASEIVIVQGTAQGIDLVMRVLRARGSREIAVENPSHTGQHDAINAAGLTLVPQAVDRDGLVVEGLRADAVLVTPAHQFPTGSLMSAERRRALLDWAVADRRLIIEDDYDAEFRYDQEPARALQGLGPDRVVHLGTVSKTLAPALRLGWVIAPERTRDEILQAKRLADDFSPALDQLTLARFIDSGEYARHLRRTRVIYRRRRDAILHALARALPELPTQGIAAGVHLVLRLPDEADDVQVSEAAEAARIRIPALSRFRLGQEPNRATPGLVFGYGRLHESAVEDAVAALAKVIRASLGSG